MSSHEVVRQSQYDQDGRRLRGVIEALLHIDYPEGTGFGPKSAEFTLIDECTVDVYASELLSTVGDDDSFTERTNAYLAIRPIDTDEPCYKVCFQGKNISSVFEFARPVDDSPIGTSGGIHTLFIGHFTDPDMNPVMYDGSEAAEAVRTILG